MSNLPDEKLFVLEEEKALYSAICAMGNLEGLAIKDCVNKLEGLVGPINNFFDKVLVMDKDEKIKNNRIALLTLLKEKLLRVCDFQYL